MAKCAWCGDYVPDEFKVGVTDPKTGKKMIINEKFCSQKCCFEHERAGFSVSERKSPKKGSCFIATAVYNNYDHPVVLDLRNFRDNYLDNRNWGKNFIKWYYKNGPLFANLIKNNYFLKKLTLIFVIKPIHLVVKSFFTK